jgi:hypothetical protein
LGSPSAKDKKITPPTPASTQQQDYIPPWEAQADEVKAAKERVQRIAEKRAKGHRAAVRRKWRNRFMLFGLIYFIYWFYNPHGIFVLADPLSVSRYRGVLKDLRQEMPEEYELVKNYIDKISISYFIPGGNYAGYAKEGERGDAEIILLENTFVQGPGYAHSTLVHEACHGLQFERKLPFSPFCQNQAREHACNQMGLKVLRHFEAKPEMIRHYERIAEGSTVYGNSCWREGTLKTMPEL